MKMRLTRLMTTTALSGILSISAAGAALADTSTISGPTGSNSTNTVTIVNDSATTTTNTNSVSLANVNVQTAKTGNALATANTTVSGPVSSGNAANTASTSTTVTVDNTGVGGLGGGSVTPPSGGGSGSGGGLGGGSGSTTPGKGGGKGGGKVLGAATGGFGGGLGGATLPDTGASSPIDVSALRSLYHQPTTIEPASVVKTAGGISAALLIGASLLSLMGAIGSTVFANRRARKLI